MSFFRRLIKWLALGVGLVAALALAAVAFLYVASWRVLERTYPVPGTTIDVPSDAESVARGERLARIRGCLNCHGADAGGELFLDEPYLAYMVAPDLTRSVHERSDAELDHIIRDGVFPDGRSTLGMPSSMFYLLSDEDVGAILAYVKSLPRADGPETEIRVGPLGRLGLVLGKYSPQAALIDRDQPRTTVDATEQLAFGRYLALTSCTECHGTDLNGGFGGQIPSLAAVFAYSADDFMKFMRTGEALGGRELELMSNVARTRFMHFSDEELAALYAFLQSRIETSAGR